MTKLYNAILGNTDAILFNSRYYRLIVLLGLLLIISTVLLNIFLIPLYGINGAAIASFITIIIYNSIKLYIVQIKFNINPFSINSIKSILLILLICLIFNYLKLPFSSPIVNILIKTIIISIPYIIIAYKLKLSSDINKFIEKITQKKPCKF